MALRKKLTVVMTTIVILALAPAPALAAPHPSCAARSVETPRGGNESIGLRLNFGACQAWVVTSEGGQVGNEYAQRNPSTLAGAGGVQVLCNPAYFPPPPG